MKKILFTYIGIMLGLFCANAQGLSERSFLTTDKAVYVAGEAIRISAFCWNGEKSSLSCESGVAYVELLSADKVAAKAKIALLSGRGAGSLLTPADLPSGNYRLVAHTAPNRYEDGFDGKPFEKIVTIFNFFSTERTSSGIEQVSDEQYRQSLSWSEVDNGALSVRVSGNEVIVKNLSGKNMTISASVRKDDGFLGEKNPSIADYLSSASKQVVSYVDLVKLEREGEIITAAVVGGSEKEIALAKGRFAFISSPGADGELYCAPVNEEGYVQFHTTGIHGNRDLVCEIEGLDEKSPLHLEIVTPAVEIQKRSLPKAKITSALLPVLEERGVQMQIGRRFGVGERKILADRENPLLSNGGVLYALDDFTRFDTMEETIIEIIKGVRVRKDSKGEPQIQILLESAYDKPEYSQGNALILVDGVPVFEHKKVMEVNPRIVKDIIVYPATFSIGGRMVGGMMNLITDRGNMPGIKFNRNVRIVDFQGVSEAVETETWKPVLNLPSEGNDVTLCTLPSSEDSILVIEGITEDGKAVIYSKKIKSQN